ncbi:MAG: hypothetical protein JPMHGGIA_01674 [Saprospiraceae bacterium]|jgi:O-antigen ligase|nr:hypothetical protein [Saprospiraceae bacterium]
MHKPISIRSGVNPGDVLAVGGLCLVAAGISWSNFLVSNGVILMGLSVPLARTHDPGGRLISTVWRKDLSTLLEDPLLQAFWLCFFSMLASGLWSENLKDWVWFSQMQLPFLLAPLVFSGRQIVLTRWLGPALYIFLGAALATSLWVLYDFALHSQEYLHGLLKGKPIVTHISHIRYSMVIALATLLCLHAVVQKIPLPLRHGPTLAAVLGLYFFGFTHLLSAKTGLLTLYGGIFLYGLLVVRKPGARTRMLRIAAVLLVAAVALAMLLPSLQNKFFYTIWQVGEYLRGKWLNYSDIERWVSIRLGLEMIRQEPLLGSGIGDLYTSTAQVYQECLASEFYKLPHNQFVFTWAFTGLFGLGSLMAAIWHSAGSRNWWSLPVLPAVQCVLLGSFMVEYTLGTQIGCTLYVFATLLSWLYVRNN